MDPLSAFQSMMTPQMRASVVPDTLTDAVNKGIQDGTKPIPASELAKLGSSSLTPSSGGVSQPDAFSNTLHQFVSEVNDKQSAAGAATKGLMAGNGVSLQQAMVAMEEASVSFQLMVEVRNKLLDSYQELMRMQV